MLAHVIINFVTECSHLLFLLGYLDAPATALAPLGPINHVGRRTYPDVTLVFCALSKYSDMRYGLRA